MSTDQQQIDPQLLRQLLAAQAEAAQAPLASAPPAPSAAQEPPAATDRARAAWAARRAAARPVRASSASSAPRGAVSEGLANLAALALGLALWLLDGYFSLAALQAIGLPIVAAVGWPWELTSAALASWAIPIGVEVLEQVFLGRRGWQAAAFAIVALPNIAATGYGLWFVLAGRAPWLTEGAWLWGLWGLVVLGGLALAFGPGRIVVAAGRSLVDLARG